MTAPRYALDPTCQRLLDLLVTGATRPAVAATLHLSPRSVDLRVAEIKLKLGTPRRFCLGARAIRHAYVDPHYPMSHAQRQRRGSGWTEPTARQRHLLRLLADGASTAEAAAEIGVSPRTARGDLGQLAAANGARSDIAAGALFEALRWT